MLLRDELRVEHDLGCVGDFAGLAVHLRPGLQLIRKHVECRHALEGPSDPLALAVAVGLLHAVAHVAGGTERSVEVRCSQQDDGGHTLPESTMLVDDSHAQGRCKPGGLGHSMNVRERGAGLQQIGLLTRHDPHGSRQVRTFSGGYRVVMSGSKSSVRFGVRGRAQRGPHAGAQVLVDVAGLTPLDPLVVLVSPDLDVPSHVEEQVLWVNPEELDALVDRWDVHWTEIADDQANDRFL